jgi:hypothetical protein
LGNQTRYSLQQSFYLHLQNKKKDPLSISVAFFLLFLFLFLLHLQPIDGGFPHAWAATRRAATAAAAPRAREEGDNGCGGSPCARGGHAHEAGGDDPL